MRCSETVYVPSPCNDECITNKKMPERSNDCAGSFFDNNMPKKHQNTFSFKNIFGNLFGKSDNDDLIIFILIVIIFLTRHKKDDDCETHQPESEDFSVTDFMSKASDILKKFNDNDILLIALLYILL